jgi:hypothetical protein
LQVSLNALEFLGKRGIILLKATTENPHPL